MTTYNLNGSMSILPLSEKNYSDQVSDAGVSGAVYGCACLQCLGSLSTVNGQFNSSFIDGNNISSNQTDKKELHFNALLAGTKWQTKNSDGITEVTYSFMTKVPDYYPEVASERTNFVAFDDTQKKAAHDALKLWETVANITFKYDDKDEGEIRFGTGEFKVQKTDDKGKSVVDQDNNPVLVVVESAHAFFPGKTIGGDLWLNNAFTPNNDQTLGSYGFYTMLHEIGHTLGLKHPGPYDANKKKALNKEEKEEEEKAYSKGILEGIYLPKDKDNWQYSLMSYNDSNDGRKSYSSSVSPQTPLLYDIVAVQSLYGANTRANLGDNNYRWNNGEKFLLAIWDAGGNDTIDASKQTNRVEIDLKPGSFSSINGKDNLALAFAIDKAGKSIDYSSADKPDNIINLIENATGGSGSDEIRGNLADNVLKGGDGNDTLYGEQGDDILDGGLGADSMLGGQGNDVYYVDNFNDTVTENTNEGIDTVNSSVTYILSENVENLTLTGDGAINGTGNILDNLIIGNNSDNSLSGADGYDTLYGGDANDKLIGGAGGDTLDGGNGNDAASYLTSTTGVTVNLSTGLAIGGDASGDVLKSIEYLEGSEFGDTLTGDNQNNRLWGLGEEDTLIGEDGDDILDGGFSNDSMLGGKDNDTYYVDSIDDKITEYTNEGDDSVFSSVTYTISDNLENLTLIGNSSISGTGNSLNNSITGNDGDNYLFGLDGNDILIGGGGADSLDGGIGADSMFGGQGDDNYYVDNINDITTENANEGNDNVFSSVTYTLGANLENLTLTGNSIINGTGNSLNNTITGNDTNNTLDGKAGNDILYGNAGNDTILGDEGDDKLIGGLGADTLNGVSGIDFASYFTATTGVTASLSTSQNNTGDAQGDVYQFIENLEGSELGDSLFGDNQSNILIGLGGDDFLDGFGGNDTLIGGKGSDTYKIYNVGDVVTEYANEGADTINAAISYILGANIENLNLLEGTAAVDGTGNELNNIINGNSANNIIDGGAGDDHLFGFAGADTFIGGDSSDWLVGGQGNDILTGGNGNDFFVYNAITDAGDRITDFTVGSDKIVLTEVVNSSGFRSFNPLVDGFFSVRSVGSSMAAIMIDPDGAAGSSFKSAPFLLLNNVSATTLNSSSNFVF